MLGDTLLRRLRTLLGRSRFESEMSEELADHVDRHAAELEARGVPPAEARRRARAELGSFEAIKDNCREASGLAWVDELRRNFGYALRQLGKSPGFSLTAVVILAVCIGANATVFSLVEAVLFRPLPYPEPESLALVVTRIEGAGGEQPAQDGRAWELLRDHAEGIAAAPFSPFATGVNFAAGGRVEEVEQQRVGAGFFAVLGVAPAAGRPFTAGEDVPGGPAVAVLSDGLARRVFDDARPAAAVGRRVLLRGEPHTVVGVMPAGFRTATPADLWTPLRPSTGGEGSGTNYGIVARLEPGVDWPRAEAEVRRAGEPALAERRYDSPARLGLVPLGRGLSQGLRSRLLLLWAAVGLVLAIGCVNVAGLLLARGAARRREVATRMALGGGRGAVVRQFLTESLVLAAAGGLAGLGLGRLGLSAIQAAAADTLGVWQTLRLDGTVLAVTAALALGATVVFGLFPAVEATRVELGATAERGGRGVAGARRRWPRQALVVVEVALGVVLLVGAGLLVRTLSHLQGLGPGFETEHVLAGRMPLADARYATRERVEGLFDRGLARLGEVPGVEQAGVGLSLPFERALNMPFVPAEGELAGERQITTLTYVTPGYLEALGVPLLRGRLLDAGDGPEAGKVVLVNRSFVDLYQADGRAAGGDAVGTHIELVGESRRVVGVVGDVLQVPSWGDYGPIDAVPAVYMPVAQTTGDFLELVHTWFSPSWVVRTAGGGDAAEALTAAVRAAAPEIPFAGFRGIERVRARALADERLQAALFSGFAAVALLLAVVGIGGLIATSVTERRRELGIRLALGATRGRAMGEAALPGVALAAAGVGLGSLAALGAGRAVRHLVHGVGPHDPATFAGVALLLLAAAAAASLIPALRITRLDPARTLRDQ